MAQFTETALQAVSIIGSGEKIWCHSMAATPTVLLAALARHATSLSDVTMMQLHLEHAEAIASPELDGHLRNRCFFAGKTTRNLINEGRADYVPMFLSEIPKLFRHREQQVDTALVQVSTPDQHGNCSLGISVEATAAACDVARRIIAHVNPNMPRTHGDSFINIRDIDYAYVEEAPLITVENKPISETEQRIGEIVASRIQDGDCLQMGIGAIPDAALSFMKDRRDLGVHTEMFSDGVLDLIEAGVITNSNKKIARGRTVTGFTMGSERLYRFVNDNPEVTFLDIEFVNNPVVIAKNPQVTSINSAIQIDLTGQVCSDSMGHKIYSGVGGQVDFVLGASFSENGKSIIALPSTARKGTLSRLVPALERGAGVVTTRALVDYVVTEYGIAALRGRSIAERARDLINIAHPDFREELSREARDNLGMSI
ncbi:acetyl-CoA hydrolase/transferase family protein [Seongchinamella sediminis]|uniref:Acetyl-CoA hydrolase/transferase family protein n=1 Tax=Seongchinamella sediminis TaxID=2283635 RepID=A0A3L7E0Z1_9GAMM|nr:acetyl-CoA hydrolase/transferase C-terminal domain-containing protein [Seongchinamella sediminis]RLQ22595.1 acetyl-CoA hydrolase/transferase family protein [Seongchinamella sediminis]